MELWIRSQDRERLVKVEDLYLLNLVMNNYGCTGIFYRPIISDRYEEIAKNIGITARRGSTGIFSKGKANMEFRKFFKRNSSKSSLFWR